MDAAGKDGEFSVGGGSDALTSSRALCPSGRRSVARAAFVNSVVRVSLW